MKIQLTIPDETYDAYATNAGRSGPAALMVDNLVRFADVRDGGRWLLIPPAQRKELEKLLGGRSHITSASQLVNRVTQRIGVKLGSVTLQLSDGQLARVRQLAERQKKSPKEFLEKVMHDVADEALGLVG